MINLKIRIVCRPYIDKLPQLYRLLGLNYSERVLLSIVYEIAGGVIVKKTSNMYLLILLVRLQCITTNHPKRHN